MLLPHRPALHLTITSIVLGLCLQSAAAQRHISTPSRSSDSSVSARVEPVIVNPAPDGKELYQRACAACHGADGTGAPATQLAFNLPMPDFSDCDFANREPDGDWMAVTHQGGPARAFAREMPAFGDALTEEELQAVLDHVRSLCSDDNWPRGELNLPRALVTEKAYPEDEAVVSSSVDVEGAGAVMSEIVYEQRFGARNQLEIVVPFGYVEQAGGWRGGGLGDIAVGVKRAVYHSFEKGRIFSVTGEIILPTGDEDLGFGSGVTVFEPFASFGQVLPFDTFVHAQTGVELPLIRENTTDEAFWRGVLGKSFSQGQFGRTWSPMVEILLSRELESDAATHWDIVPQFQVTLNKRQNIMANLGVRLPLDDASRDAQIIVYLLWDWFDGGFFDGW